MDLYDPQNSDEYNSWNKFGIKEDPARIYPENFWAVLFFSANSPAIYPTKY